MEGPTKSGDVDEGSGRDPDGDGSDGGDDIAPAWYGLDPDQDTDPNVTPEDGDEDVMFSEASFEGSYD